MNKNIIALPIILSLTLVSCCIFANTLTTPPPPASSVAPFPAPTVCDGSSDYKTCYINKSAIPGCQEFVEYGALPSGSCIAPVISTNLALEKNAVNLCKEQMSYLSSELIKNIQKDNPQFNADSLHQSCLYASEKYYAATN